MEKRRATVRRKAQERQDTLRQIAQNVLGCPTLEARNSDSLDFKEHAIWNIKEALEKAYDAGRRAGQ